MSLFAQKHHNCPTCRCTAALEPAPDIEAEGRRIEDATLAELVEVLQRAVDGYGQKMRTATDKKEKRDWQSMLIAAVDIQHAALAKIKEPQP